MNNELALLITLLVGITIGIAVTLYLVQWVNTRRPPKL